MSEKLKSEIERIVLDDATFKGTGEYIEPTYINYFFGNNGTGKSTIAKAIQAGKNVTYKGGKTHDEYLTLVYNQEFIDKNMRSYHNLPGVFTINEVNVEIQNQIDEKEKLLETAKRNMYAAKAAVDNKSQERDSRLKDFQKKCFDKMEDLRTQFILTQDGKKRAKQFTEEVRTHEPVEHDLQKLKLMYDAAYSDSAKHYERFNDISEAEALDDLEGNDILNIVITNAAQTELAKFLEDIGATQWFRTGHNEFHGKAGNRCPYCSKKLPENFEETVAASFDDRYKKNLERLNTFLQDYMMKVNEIFLPLSKVPAEIYPGIDIKPYNDKLNAIKGIISGNIELIREKKADPAKMVSLVETATAFRELSGMIQEFNKVIDANNAIVSAGPKKKQECKNQVFEHMAFELRDLIDDYDKNDAEIVKEIGIQNGNISVESATMKELRTQISELRSKTVDTGTAIRNINTMLKDAGFHGFEVRPREEDTHGSGPTNYEVVRTETGKVAENLSEGEKNFIAFLYFQQEVFGRASAEGDTREKIVVIDDPVSSMDSGTLFIIGDQIRKMIEICRNNVDSRNASIEGNFIRQIFILTHNAYFHREVAYVYANQYDFVSFYLIKKAGTKSSVKLMEKPNPSRPTEMINVNPVKNSYAALWEEYKELIKAPNDAIIQTALLHVIRRILEYYFLQICGYSSGKLRKAILEDNKLSYTQDRNGNEDPTKFDLAKAMLSYIASGTYGVNDGFQYVDDTLDMEQCKETFRMIFEDMGQIQHYRMMMGER